MSRALRAVSVAALAIVVEAQAAAQTSTASWASSLTVGQRVRVHSTTEPGRVAGGIAAVDSESLTVVPDGWLPVTIPVRSITTIDASRGRKRNWLKGLAIGFALGVGVGFALPVDATNCGPTSTSFCSRGEALAGSTVLLGGVGTGVGAFITSERWTPIGDWGLGIGDREDPVLGSAVSASRP
jgi:hypothetical protein